MDPLDTANYTVIMSQFFFPPKTIDLSFFKKIKTKAIEVN